MNIIPMILNKSFNSQRMHTALVQYFEFEFPENG